MKWQDFFIDDKTKMPSSSRLLFIVGGLIYILCSSVCYVWFVITTKTFDMPTLTLLGGVITLATKIAIEKRIAAKDVKNDSVTKV